MTLNIASWREHCAAMKNDFPWRYDHPGEHIYAPLLLKQLSEALPENSVFKWTLMIQHLRPRAMGEFSFVLLSPEKSWPQDQEY
jgi:hypothetical protein